jgi:hypothetical protein
MSGPQAGAAGGYPNYPKSWDGQLNRGLHNGYSHYSCANRTGEYVLAFGTNPLSILYRLADLTSLGPVKSKSGAFIGDQAEPRWTRRTDEAATVLYYHVSTILYKQDVLLGSQTEQVIYDMGSTFIQTDDNELSNDGRYGCYRLSNGSTIVFDFQAGQPLAGKITAATVGVDLSPDGQWADVMGLPGGTHYYRIADLADGDTSHPVIRTDRGGHGGWGYDSHGNCVNLYQCNDDDWIKAFNPATGEKMKIIHYTECGWGMNQHIGRMSNPAMKGWALVSTYSTTDTTWSYNQLFMLEIKPSIRTDGTVVPVGDRPRIWRLGHTQGNYYGNVAVTDGTKSSWYFTEAFANVDMEGKHVYWGANWRGQDNLELYRLELPDDWHAILSGTVNAVERSWECYQ